jgi:hypothetical protein
MLSRFECYELCVQSARHVTTFLHAVHGQNPTVLAEDFCGSAAVSRRWIADAARAGDHRRALAIDLDPETLAAAAALARQDLGPRYADLELRAGDCILAPATDPCDVVFVGNFSIGYCLTRDALLAYLRGAKARLDAGNGGFGGGAFVCDLYGGANAFRLGALERIHPGRGHERIRYLWRHLAADPISGLVENTISFRVEVDGEVLQDLPEAFRYRWRLWSLPELHDALAEIGFRDVSIYRDVNLAPGQQPRAVESPEELGEDWIVLIAAR